MVVIPLHPSLATLRVWVGFWLKKNVEAVETVFSFKMLLVD